jgi:hypothetical protein
MRSISALPIMLFVALFAPAPGALAADQSFQLNTDAAGGDYRHFDLPKPRPRICQEACYGDDICKAWTFYKPGLLGPLAICWLKSSEPTMERDDCCISGIRAAKP